MRVLIITAFLFIASSVQAFEIDQETWPFVVDGLRTSILDENSQNCSATQTAESLLPQLQIYIEAKSNTVRAVAVQKISNYTSPGGVDIFCFQVTADYNLDSSIDGRATVCAKRDEIECK